MAAPKRTRIVSRGRMLPVDADQVVAAWRNRGDRKIEDIAADFGVSRTVIENRLNARGVCWRVVRAARDPLTKPCECGDPECIVEQREDEDSGDFRRRKYATQRCRYLKPRNTKSFGCREPEHFVTLDDGRCLDRLLDVYGARNGEDDLPEMGQLGRLVTVRNEYGRIVS